MFSPRRLFLTAAAVRVPGSLDPQPNPAGPFLLLPFLAGFRSWGCDPRPVARALAEVGGVRARQGKGSGRLRALPCAGFPDAEGICARRRPPAVGFSSASGSVGTEVSTVCAFVAGGADVGHGSAAHTKASQVIGEASGLAPRPPPPDGHGSFVGPAWDLLAQNRFLGRFGISGVTPDAFVRADEPRSFGTRHPR